MEALQCGLTVVDCLSLLDRLKLGTDQGSAPERCNGQGWNEGREVPQEQRGQGHPCLREKVRVQFDVI